MRCEVRDSLTHIYELDTYADHISNLKLEPLEITFCAATDIQLNDNIALDSILAYAVVVDQLQGCPFPPHSAYPLPYYLPIPLQVDRVINNLPLWSSNDFAPLDLSLDHTHYHRRSGDNPYAINALIPTLQDKRPRRIPATVHGQYMNYRMPVKLANAKRWQATCIGNLEEISRLLRYITNVGGRRQTGGGRVIDWHVEPLDHEFSFYQDNKALRPIPAPFGVKQGWTSPYWRRDIWLPCER